jgi:hypothetical protein
MMLKPWSGSTVTGSGFAPFGASHASKAIPAAEPSSATRLAVIWPATPSSCFATPASRKNTFAPLSFSIITRLSGVEDGASGATIAPARRMPKKVAPYSTEVVAQTAATSASFTPSRCRATAMRSISSSSSA